ncbi:MAG: patatin-like phospholipase family protein [Bacteroidota bacterium]
MLWSFMYCLNSAWAQNTNEPKVGLVLSGGGAKGFAHIGVLKVLDSLDVKVDYIAGTSMGAIIGSLYASGYTGKQLDSIFTATEFNDLINDVYPRPSKSLYERSNDERYIINLPFDNFKIDLPSGISRGQNVYNLLYKLMFHINDTKNFDELPIPFFCIATNLETGKPVVMKEGNLAQAVSASGAFPSLFQPVMIDDQLYIDGGVTNNYPIELLKGKGMDIIIGADVQDGYRDREALKSATDILVQINNFRTIDQMQDKAKLTDIYIKPDIEDFSVISFSEGRNIIDSGEQATLKSYVELKKLKRKRPFDKGKIKLKDNDTLYIKGIRFSGNKDYTRSYLLGKLKLKTKEPVTFDDINDGMVNLVATNNFEAIRYQLDKIENGYVLNMHIQESKGRNFIKLGAHYDDLYRSAALINITKKKVLFKNDIISLDVGLGDNIRYDFDYFVDKGFYLSLGINSRYNQFERNSNANLVVERSSTVLNEVNKIEVEFRDWTNQFYVQTLFVKDFSLRLGLEHKHLTFKTETLIGDNEDQDEIFFEDTDYLSLFGSLKLDTLDDAYFPDNGFYLNGDIHWYLSASQFNADFEPFSIVKADFGYAFSLGKFSVLAETSGGFKLGDNSTTSLDFAMGGYARNFVNNFSSFYGYDLFALTGNSFVKALLNFDYEIFKKNHIIGAINMANIEDNIFDTGEWLTSPDYTGFAIGYSLETFIGPIEFKYAKSPELSDGFWWINLGFWF